MADSCYRSTLLLNAVYATTMFVCLLARLIVTPVLGPVCRTAKHPPHHYSAAVVLGLSVWGTVRSSGVAMVLGGALNQSVYRSTYSTTTNYTITV